MNSHHLDTMRNLVYISPSKIYLYWWRID